MAKVLLVEDDADIRPAVRAGLAERGHTVSTTGSGLEALQLVLDTEPDVVLLDLGLPDVDGLEALRMLRAVRQVPVIVITARDDDATIVAALDSGADDYVVKPFGLDHVAARIRAVLRRGTTGHDSSTVRIGELVIEVHSRTVTLGGVPVELTRKEFDLLLALGLRPGDAVAKSAPVPEVWQQPYGGGDRTVDVHLSWLRRKLGESAAAPRYLHTVRGVGIRLSAPADDAVDERT
jgi:DNA-binding response OmpR family regulator